MSTLRPWLIGIALVSLSHRAQATAGIKAESPLERLRHFLPLAAQTLGRHTEAIEPRVISTQDDPSAPVISLKDLSDPAALERRLRALIHEPYDKLQVQITDGEAHVGSFSIGSNETVEGDVLVVRGRAEVFGRVTGNLVSLDSDILVHRGGTINGDAMAIGGDVRNLGGTIQGEIRSVSPTPEPSAPRRSAVARVGVGLAGLIGTLLTLGLIGFGLVLFGKPQLETVSDTVTHSFLRSFLVGLLSQVLVVPTFGMLVVGLALSVVGILLIPFVVAIYLLLVVGAVLGGVLAVAHAMGEARTRRQMALGVVVSPNSFRYLALGLAGLGAVWLVWVLFGWVPVAGSLVFAAASLTTWLLATVGLGACVLSRAGIRPSFAGRYLPPEMMTDEYLWATPQQGVPAAKRPPRP